MRRCNNFFFLITFCTHYTITNTSQPCIAIDVNKALFTFQEPWRILSYKDRNKIEKKIVFLEDNAQQRFVLKCYSKEQIEEAICEDLGSFIGVSVGVPVHKVQMIEGGPLLAEINNGTSLATLHTEVPGKELCKWFESPPNDIILKGGLISEKHLKCLVLSDDLCDLMALDIFLNNRDRHCENCFFDEAAMRYYGIDMGDVFLAGQRLPNEEKALSVEAYISLAEIIFTRKPLAVNVYNFLKTVMAADLSVEQVRALKRVQRTLHILLHLYPAEVVFGLWMLKAEAIDYTYTEYKKIYLRTLLHYNTYWVQRVVDMISQLTT